MRSLLFAHTVFQHDGMMALFRLFVTTKFLPWSRTLAALTSNSRWSLRSGPGWSSRPRLCSSSSRRRSCRSSLSWLSESILVKVMAKFLMGLISIITLLHGPLIIQGSAEPSINAESFWICMNSLRLSHAHFGFAYLNSLLNFDLNYRFALSKLSKKSQMLK